MNDLSVLIVDDEPIARRRLRRLLSAMDGIQIAGEAGDATEAIDSVQSLRPDLILLDIQMPGGNGFDVLDKLGKNAPAVIFVTAFDHYALRAFEESAVDYVTKPVEEGRLSAAIGRARSAVRARADRDRVGELEETVATLRRALRETEGRPQPFWMKSRGEFLRIGSEKVVRIQAERDYVRIFANGQSYLLAESLASLERRLDGAEFIRIHRGVIVRRDAIVRFRRAAYASLVAVLSDGSVVRVGRTFAKAVRAEIGQSR